MNILKINNYSVNGIIELIKNYYNLKEVRLYKGDSFASDLIMDIDLLLDNCNLSDRQFVVVEKCWKEGWKQDEVANLLGVSQQMVDKHTRSVKKKIEKILREWGEIQ